MQSLCDLLVLLIVLAVSGTALAVMLGLVERSQLITAAKKVALIALAAFIVLWAATNLIRNYVNPALHSASSMARGMTSWIWPCVVIAVLIFALAAARRSHD